MFKTTDLLNYKNIDEVLPEIVYEYLFEGTSLTGIEFKLFHTEKGKGWISKAFLNYLGIDTSTGYDGNKGIFKGQSVSNVVDKLSKSSDAAHVRIANLLRERYLSD